MRAGERSKGATAFVTLEPCAHQGKTPPCADALVKAGISRAVVATMDPDPRVSGKGLETLRAAGIEVELGVLGDEAAALNAGFFLSVSEARPLVTLKLATSLDGRIAAQGGDSKWITGEHARSLAHGLRARHDAVAIGIETALSDDPSLTCRLPGMAATSPVRVVFDTNLRLPLDGHLLAAASDVRLILVASDAVEPDRKVALEAKHAEVLLVPPGRDGRPDLATALSRVAELGITRMLCEGGGGLAAALVAAGFVDRIAWFRAPSLIGGDGLPSIGSIGVQRVAEAPAFIRTAMLQVGNDTLETYGLPA